MRGAMAKMLTCRTCGRDFARYLRTGRNSYCRHCTAKADKEIARILRVDCRECGKPFPTKSRVVRYCSDECRSSAARRRNAENQRKYTADPEKRAIKLARARASRAARRAGDRGKRPPSPPRAGRAAVIPRRNAEAAEQYACGLCGRHFEPYGRGSRPVHCRQCAAKADKEIARMLSVDCRECGREFSTPSRLVKYCSRECSAARKSRSRRERERRRMADPNARALAAAYMRAWGAARRGGEKGGRRRNAQAAA